MLYKTKILKEAMEIPQSDFGKDIVNIVESFRAKKHEVIPTLFFLVKEAETHATFYSVSFNIDDSNDIYHDIFLGCYVLDYTQTSNRLIEMEDDHEANYPFNDELYKQLASKPCYLLKDLQENGFEYFFSNGFPASSYTKFKENVELLKSGEVGF